MGVQEQCLNQLQAITPLSHVWDLCTHPLFLCLASVPFQTWTSSLPLFLSRSRCPNSLLLAHFCLGAPLVLFGFSKRCRSPNPHFFFALSKSTLIPFLPGFYRNLPWPIQDAAMVPLSASETRILLLQGMLPAESSQLSTEMALCQRKQPCPWLRF